MVEPDVKIAREPGAVGGLDVVMGRGPMASTQALLSGITNWVGIPVGKKVGVKVGVEDGGMVASLSITAPTANSFISSEGAEVSSSGSAKAEEIFEFGFSNEEEIL